MIWCVGYIEWMYLVWRMIDRRTCWWGPKVVGLVRVEGKRFGLTGRVVRCPGYREVYVGQKRDNRGSIEYREQYLLSI